MKINAVSEVQTTQKEPESERRIFTFEATQVAWLLLSIFEALIALRFVLKLIGAKPAKPVSPFVAVLYVFTGFFRLRVFQV